MKYIYFTTLLVLASATLGSAQFNTDLSENCKNALTKLVGDKDINACFPFGSVASLATSANANGMPDPNALKTAADSICGLPKCSDDLVAKTQTDVKNACQEDLGKKDNVVQFAVIALTLYSPTRDSICFKNSTDGYCFIESQMAAQQILSTTPKGQDPALTFAGAPKEVVCTPCNKAIFNTYFNYQKSNPDAFTQIKKINPKDIDTAKSALTGKCGANFIDGNVGDSTLSADKFQTQSNQQSDAVSLIANRFSFVALVGSIIATL